METASGSSRTHAAAVLLGWYVILTAACIFVRVTASLLGAPAWIVGSMPWSEIFYGPAIAVAAMFTVPRLGANVEAWLKARA